MSASWRTALVTGGGSGLGKAVCHRLARDGMAVGVLDIDGEAAKSVAAAISQAGGRAIALFADVSDRQEVNVAVSDLRRAFGAVGVLINNAAVENFSAFGEIRDEVWDHLIDTNLKGAFIVTQAVLPDMVAMRWGANRERLRLGRADRCAQHGPLHGQQGRHHRHDALAGDGAGAEGRHGQFGIARLHRHAHGTSRDRWRVIPCSL